MDFRLLGPLEVAEHDRKMSLGGVRQRSVLAILLLHVNEVVSSDRLIDELWGASAPDTAAKALQVNVSRIRRAIGPGKLVTQAPGYLLQLDRSEYDLGRFEQLVAEASRSAPETAAAKLREALALWRGPALADLAYESFAQPEIARLEELRVSVLGQRIDADLDAGGHAQLVGELEALVARHPLRERFRYQLMLALYRSARQAEALDVYRAARRELADEFGLEPSEELKRLEQAILRQDPALEPTEQAKHARPVPPSPERALLITTRGLDRLDDLLDLARPLASSQPPRELIAAAVVPPAELRPTTAVLGDRRQRLLAEGVATRTAAFSSPTPGEDIIRLASEENIDLLLMDAAVPPLVGEVEVVLEHAPCDVALLVESGGSLRGGPIVVPFGAANHDWAALELGAWVARATGSPLQLIGAASDERKEVRDASRLLADASLVVQHTAGVVAEPLLASPGRRGILALAEGAGLLVVGLSERWRQEGLGPVRAELANAPPAPTVFARKGPRPGGLAPAETRTRFSWSLTWEHA
jgi:DNA-binding SARP family transcriptional activator